MRLKRVISLGLCAAMLFGSISISAAEEAEPIEAEEVTAAGESEMLPYQDESLSFEERAADLVSRMTLEEKVAQLGHSAPAISRLGVSKYNYWREALHGVARNGRATSFPSPLSMSNTWDRELLGEEGSVIGTEARAKAKEKNIKDLSYWSPTINMSRDPRWGRNDETLGEDPYLTTQYGDEFVSGMQGSDSKYLQTIATLKHYVANNCEGERQQGSSVMDEQTLREYYARAFEDIIEDSAPASVMSSYNATTVTRNGEQLFDYLPSSSNPYLLTELLRRTFGFNGYVVSDCGSLNNNNSRLPYKRTLFPDRDLSDVTQAETWAPTIKAGNDLDCGSVSQAYAYEAVENGYVTEEDLDVALYRCFLQRFRTGEFDSTNPYAAISTSELETAAHVDVAEKAAEEAWVLLKNDGILPVTKENPNIAIVGDMAGTTYLGDYSGEPVDTTSPYKGLCEEFGEENVHYLGGVDDNEVLLNVKSLNLVKADGTKTSVDLSKATAATGLTVSGTSLKNLTKSAQAVIKNVDFSNVVSVEAELATGSNTENAPVSTLLIGYGSATLQVAAIKAEKTETAETYATVSAAYTGADGGYNGTADLYITVSPAAAFSVSTYKEELDAADVILAYGATTTADSKESNDRSSISMPSHQSHVKAICDAYPDKTVVVLQTVGQMDVSTFENNAKAIMWTCYNGQKQGTALASIISGKVNPSGRLSTTWYDPADLLKMPCSTTGGGTTDSAGIKWYRNTNYQIRQSGDYPGRSYQYYSGTPVYSFGYGLSYTDFKYSNMKLSSNTADANGAVNVSVDVENTGSVAGDEVVQLYVKVPGGDGVNLPLKQLKGFERVSLEAGEKKTVTMTLDIADIHFYDEATQTEYVPTGNYTIMAGKNANDADMLSESLNVSGTLKSELSVVCAVPNGIQTIGAINEDGTLNSTLKSINIALSAKMSDEAVIELDSGNTAYSSSNTEIVVVDENGTITAGTKDGTAIITAEVTVDGVTKSATVPVTNLTKAAITDAMRAEKLAALETAYKSYDMSLYSAVNQQLITSIYEAAKAELETMTDSDLLDPTTDKAVADMAAVRKMPAPGTKIYEITSMNDTIYGNIETEITYNGDSMDPKAVVLAAVYNADGTLNRVVPTDIADTGSYVIEGNFVNGDKTELYIWDSVENMQPLSDKISHDFTISDNVNVTFYNFSDSDFDSFRGLTEGITAGPVNGISATGAIADKSKNVTYSFNGTDYKFTKSLQTGSGSTAKANLFFTPAQGYSKCTVTVIFDGNGGDGRVQNIAQGGKVLATANSVSTGVTELTAEITDFSQPVYTYGGGSNKNIYAMIIAYE